MKNEYGFDELKLKQTTMKKIQKLKYEKFETQNHLLQLQPDIAHEAFKVRSGCTKKLFKQIQLSPSIQCAN